MLGNLSPTGEGGLRWLFPLNAYGPAPFVHASDDATEVEFRARYCAFVDVFRAGAERLRKRARELADIFPLWSFPPALPFNAPA